MAGADTRLQSFARRRAKALRPFDGEIHRHVAPGGVRVGQIFSWASFASDASSACGKVLSFTSSFTASSATRKMSRHSPRSHRDRRHDKATVGEKIARSEWCQAHSSKCGIAAGSCNRTKGRLLEKPASSTVAALPQGCVWLFRRYFGLSQASCIPDWNVRHSE